MITNTEIRILSISQSNVPTSNNDGNFRSEIVNNSTVITLIGWFNSEDNLSIQYESVYTLTQTFNSPRQIEEFVIDNLSDLNSDILRSFSLNPGAVL